MRGGFVLLDILRPCVTFNKRNTFKWCKDRVRTIDDSHDPTDASAAMKLARQWGDEIPIGILYRSDRPGFESHWDVLKRGPLTKQYTGKASTA